MTGEFSIKDSLWYNFSLKKNTCDLGFDRIEVILPAGMELARATLSHSQKFLTMELRLYQEKVNKDKKEELEEVEEAKKNNREGNVAERKESVGNAADPIML